MRTLSMPLLTATLLIAVALPAPPVAAATILSPGSIWEYTFTDPTADSNWNLTTGGWTTGPAPFGTSTVSELAGGGYDTNFAYQTLWNADGADGDDLWVRTSIDLTGYDLSTIAWGLGVDNGFKLYVNGTEVASGNAEGFTTRWEYSGAFLQALLNPGQNIIAVALEDHGGLTAFDMEVTGSPVPLPAALWMLGSALVGLAGLGRRRAG